MFLLKHPYSIASTLLLCSLLALSVFTMNQQPLNKHHIQNAFFHLNGQPGIAFSVKDLSFRSYGLDPSVKSCIGCFQDEKLGFIYGSFEKDGR